MKVYRLRVISRQVELCIEARNKMEAIQQLTTLYRTFQNDVICMDIKRKL